MQTGPSPIQALNKVNVHIYSDFLLHDMGEVLADNRPDGSATGREWRTAPLWGTRLVAEFLGGPPFFLHDGRATTLEGAIRAHSGEAQETKEAFFNLPEAEQQAIIAFLQIALGSAISIFMNCLRMMYLSCIRCLFPSNYVLPSILLREN